MATRRRSGPVQAKVSTRSAPGDPGRRASVLEAAAKVFSVHGFSSSTVRQIGDEAGLLSGSLYYHFESKDAMLEEILGVALADLILRYGSVADTVPGPIDCLRSLIVTAVEWILRNPHSSTILQNDFTYIRQAANLGWVNDKYLEVRQIWLSVLRRGVEAGALSADLDIELVYLTIYGSLLSTIRWHEDVRHSSTRELAIKQADIFLFGLVRAGQP